MTIKDFNKLVETQCERIKATLTMKQSEYNFSGDRFDSFKKAALLENTTPERVLEGYLTKHIISLYDMLNSEEKFSKERWEEKLGDSINYLVLLRGLLEDDNMFKENK